jgi:hypothetical protein
MKSSAHFSKKIRNQTVQSSGIALNVDAYLKSFPSRHNGDAVITDRTVDNDSISRLCIRAVDWERMFNRADSGRRNEYFISRATRHNLGISGND